MCDDLISRKAAMRLIDAEELERDGWHLCRTVQVDRNTMEYQTKKPTAFTALEIVRCKDCIEYQTDIHWTTKQTGWCYCTKLDQFFKPEDYCSYGVKRGDIDG